MTRMRTEIAQQPDALQATLDALLPFTPDVESLAGQTRQVLFIARGSSDNAAVYGRYLAEVVTGRLGTLASPSVATSYGSRIDLSGVLAVALSQSGRTEEIIETVAWARDCGARTVAITNDAGSPLAELAELALTTQAGEERAVPATKTYTTQLLALAVLALGLGDAGGRDVSAFRDELRRVPAEVRRLLDVTGGHPGGSGEAVAELVEELAGARGVVVSGRGFAYSTALELALKLEESCYLSAIGLSYADLLHGPIAVVDSETPALLVSPGTGPMVPGMVSLARRVTSAGAGAYALGGDAALAEACTRALPGPALSESLSPFGLIVPGQLLVESLARRLGIDPDTPRGLGKVTQTTSQ